MPHYFDKWPALLLGLLLSLSAGSVTAAGEIFDYSTSAASNNDAAPDGAPEGMAPSDVNDTMRETMARLARWYNDIGGLNTSTGSSNAYALAASQVLSNYAAGQVFVFEANHANTGAATLNVDSVGAKAIKKNKGEDLESGDIVAGQIIAVVYDSGDDTFQMLSPVANFLGALVDDTSPQLGGDLDTNGNSIDQIFTTNATGGDQGADTINASELYADGEQVTPLTVGTEQSSTGSETELDFTSIPASISRISVNIFNISTNGTSPLVAQIGDSGGVEATGYLGSVGDIGGSAGNSTTGAIVRTTASAAVWKGRVVIELEDPENNTWIATFTMSRSDSAAVHVGSWSKALSGTLDRVRISTTGGTDALDSGSVNIQTQ